MTKKQHRYPDLGESPGLELNRSALTVNSGSKQRRTLAFWCCKQIGTRLDSKHVSVTHGHNYWYVCFAYQESGDWGTGCYVLVLRRHPHGRSYCSSVESDDLGKGLHLRKRYIHLGRGIPAIANMQSMDHSGVLMSGLSYSFEYTARLSFRTRNSMENPPLLTGKGCEASNIYITFSIALSEIQHHVGMDVFLETSINFPLFPMIPAILVYLLSTRALGMPLH